MLVTRASFTLGADAFTISAERRPRHPGGPSAQSKERQPGAAPYLADRLLRDFGLREVVACLRHGLCGGPASLRRVPQFVRPSVPGPDGQARRRLHRGPEPRDLDRPEVGPQEPTFDRRHDYRDLRLPPPAVRSDRAAALSSVWEADRSADPGADRRPDPRSARGNPVPGARTDRQGSQG